MKYYRKFIIPFALFLSLASFFGCKDYWDDHTQFKQYYSNITLLDKIKQDPELSKFVQYLNLTGYDQVLASGQSFTVWAPKNEGFAGLDATYAIADDVTSITDTVQLKKLKLFVSNHICNRQLSNADLKKMDRVKNLSGKNLILSNQASRIEESDVIKADQFCNNGVLHTVSKPLTPKMSIWEYLMASADANTFRSYIKQYDIKIFDRANSTPIRFDSEKNQIVYDSVFSQSNAFLLSCGRLDVEDSLYTFVVLTDNALQAEKDKFTTYFTSATPFKSDSLVYWNIYKDFVVNGKYESATAPSTLVSTDEVTIPFDKSAVVSSYAASNGIVYVMNRCSVAIGEKIKPIIIDPNYQDWWVSTDNITFYERYGSTASGGTQRGYIKNRKRDLALNGYDLMYSGWASGKGAVMFPTALYSNTRLKFYWTAVNDFQAAPIAQSMSLYGNVPAFIPQDSIRFKAVPTQEDFNQEVYLGEGTSNLYGTYSIKVYSGYTTASSTTPIVLNYIKIVPVVE